jgi:isopenicillin-N N-acyltransferase-like protein
MFREDAGLTPEEVADLGLRTADSVRAFRPDLAAEIEGIATGSGLAPALLFAINARTELLSGGFLAVTGGECSTLGIVDEGGTKAILAQTWDFHPDLRSSRVIWTIESQGGTMLTTFTEAGIVGKLGLNDRGLAVGMNFLASERDARTGGVPVHVLARATIEGAGTVAEASELICTTATAASVCLTVAGPAEEGTVEMAAVERRPGGASVWVAGGSPARLVHTNHYLETTAGGGWDGIAEAGSISRYEQLTEASVADPRCELEAIGSHLSSTHVPPGGEAIFRRADPAEPWLLRCATLATVAFEVPSGRLWLKDGLDADEPFAPVATHADRRSPA